MKNNNGIMIIMLIFATGMMFKILYTNTNPEINPSIAEEISDEVECDSLIEDEPIEVYTTTTNFDYTYNRFKVFNPDLDSSTVILFNNVCSFYGLDTTEQMLEWCVGQILLESGAKQYYETKHPKSGQLVESYAGAIGFSQIMPLTAHEYITKKISSGDASRMVELGAQPFDCILDSTCAKVEVVDMTKEWLSNETNNIILWGFIMRSKLDKRPNILKVLVSYNSGTTGMINYVGSGGLLINHKYVRGIKVTLGYANKMLDLVPS